MTTVAQYFISNGADFRLKLDALGYKFASEADLHENAASEIKGTKIQFGRSEKEPKIKLSVYDIVCAGDFAHFEYTGDNENETAALFAEAAAQFGLTEADRIENIFADSADFILAASSVGAKKAAKTRTRIETHSKYVPEGAAI